MNVEHAFFTCLTFAIIGLVILFINIATAMLDFRNPRNVFVIHAFAALLYIFGGLGILGFGIVWALQYIKH